MSNEKQVLLNRVQVCEFALVETALFLDSHPEDKAALAFYKKNQELLNAARAEYVEKFGPLTHSDYDGGPRWNWVDGPWPWENVKED